jgi:hypothetical protein
MREIEVSKITEVVERLCIDANNHLPCDVKKAIEKCRACEDGEIACGVLDNIIENYNIADRENVPICQDTGMACVFLEIGQDVHFVGGDLTDAINEGVRRGYDKGYLRKSVVKDPVRRGNTGDNTPAMIYTEIVPGENVKVTLGPKGCRYSNGREWGEVETPNGINVIDTTGAGDIFGGSVLSRILLSGKAIGEITGEELGKMTRFACCAASLSTQRSGGISSVVPMEDVLALAEA